MSGSQIEERDDLPIFRPRMGRGRPARTSSGATTLRNALLAKLRQSPGARRAPGSAAVRGLGDGARRVVVKAHVLRLNASGAKAAALHLRYIERDGVEKDGSKGVLYNAEGPARAEAFEQPRFDEKHQFRLIVAPEDGGQLDLTAYVRRL